MRKEKTFYYNVIYTHMANFGVIDFLIGDRNNQIYSPFFERSFTRLMRYLS